MKAELARNRKPDFSSPAPEAIIQTVATALRANNIDARVADTGDEAGPGADQGLAKSA